MNISSSWATGQCATCRMLFWLLLGRRHAPLVDQWHTILGSWPPQLTSAVLPVTHCYLFHPPTGQQGAAGGLQATRGHHGALQCGRQLAELPDPPVLVRAAATSPGEAAQLAAGHEGRAEQHQTGHAEGAGRRAREAGPQCDRSVHRNPGATRVPQAGSMGDRAAHVPLRELRFARLAPE